MLQLLHLIIMGINHHLYEFSPTSKTFGTNYSWDEAIKFKIHQHSFLFLTFKFFINKNSPMSIESPEMISHDWLDDWLIDWLIISFINEYLLSVHYGPVQVVGAWDTRISVNKTQISLFTGVQKELDTKYNHNK